MDTTFSDDALDQYIAWQTEDPKTIKRINALLQDIRRNGFLKGIGKPEVLKNGNGYSRRIDDKNRLVYNGDEKQQLVIISCKGHYDDR